VGSARSPDRSITLREKGSRAANTASCLEHCAAQVDQGQEFIEYMLDEIERFLAAKAAALRRSPQADPNSVDVPTGGLALDFAKHTDPEVELKRLVAARGMKDVVYIRSRSRVTAAPGSNPFKRLVSRLTAHDAVLVAAGPRLRCAVSENAFLPFCNGLC